MHSIDTILNAKWLIPVDEAETVRDNHSLVIDDGKIVDILPTSQANTQYQARENIDLLDHALIPGLINSHTHAGMNLLRGFADDLALMDWLQNHIWPAEAKWVSPEFVYDGTQLAIAESIRSGVTCFNDMYFFPDEAATAVSEAGFRATIGLIVIDFPTVWATNADEYLEKALALHDTLKPRPRINTTLAPHAPYTVSDEPLKKIASYAEQLDIPIHIHLHETAFEVHQAEKNTGKRPIQRLNELGLISPRLLAVHMTQLNEGEIQLCAKNGVHIAHCPDSNMKLASGMCPVQQLQQANINVCLGTDSASSNNNLDMLGEMRSAALLAKGVSGDATAVPAYTALKMATINGAKALDIDDITGSLEKGKAADITAIDLSELETQPLYNPVSQIVYAASRAQITHVWV
ncbi:MAG TPA: TRZ/ATZ family hydrolase, partial [Gammaproteobacteria bacterium]|nr:TRZ/ATZ family hydrolase [Gammaproteobacteria bacterium]